MLSSGKYIINLFLLLIIQIIVMNNIQFSSYVYINVYVLAILVTPVNMHKTYVLFLGFLLGLFIDSQSHSMGIHTISMTLTAYFVPYVQKVVYNTNSRDIEDKKNIMYLGRFSKYVFFCLLIFNSTLFFIESIPLSNVSLTLIRIFSSTFISFIFIFGYYLLAIIKKS